ncbi:MAG TPA: hypothetical protein VF112_09895 [Candidatus Dormibacteraeota bacterium]
MLEPGQSGMASSPEGVAPQATGSWASPPPAGEAPPVPVGLLESPPPGGGPVSLAAPGPQGEALVPAAFDVPRHDYDRLWLADRISTPQERQAFRASLGWRYDAAVRSVARLLAEHPGLRGAQTDEALMTELAAVRVFVARAEAELVESIRSGAGERDVALAVCAAAGLRRLPSLQGVVVRGGPPDPSAADAYRPGQDLIEAAPLIALDDLDVPVSGKVEILIWSATARRLNGFVEDRTTPEVVFLPGTVFRVVAVDPPGAPGARRVLLTEVPPTKAGPGHEDWAARITARLEEAAANRAAPTGEAAEDDGRFAPLPGDPARSMR